MLLAVEEVALVQQVHLLLVLWVAMVALVVHLAFLAQA
jgi:hypothetical protein